MVIKYTKIFHCPPKFTQIGIFGLKTNHLATLVKRSLVIARAICFDYVVMWKNEKKNNLKKRKKEISLLPPLLRRDIVMAGLSRPVKAVRDTCT
jgi:hypothetical protein